MNDYQQQILDHYKNPRNFGKPSWTPTHTKKLQNLSCGDEVEVFLKIENDQIKDVSFVAEGCSIAIGAMSLLSEEIKKMTLDKFAKFDLNDLMQILGIELTPTRQKCANLGLEAIKGAV
jgi:nitrogen fixation NifU-like protein